MTNWEEVASFLDYYKLNCREDGEFAVGDLADFLGSTIAEASTAIQNYHQAKRNNKNKVPQKSIIRKAGTRTTRAKYFVGNGKDALREMARSYASDVLCKWERSTSKDMRAFLRTHPNVRNAMLNALTLQIEAFLANVEVLTS